MSSGARALVASMAAVVPAGAGAQTRLELLPSLTLSHAYDDNLFSSPEPALADRISGAAPRLELLLRSPRVLGRASYRQEAEWFRSARALDASDARREGALELRYDGRRGLRLTGTGSYRTTRTPGELLPTLGLELGRIPARQLAAAQRLALPLSAHTSASFGYSFVGDELSGGLAGRSQELEAGVERRLSAHTSALFEYGWRRFSSGAEDGATHVLGLGFVALGRSSRLRLLAGPRVSDGRLDASPELELELRRSYRRGELAATYARSQLRIIGLSGVAATENAGLRIARELVRSRLQLSASPGWFHSRHPAFESDTYRLDSELRWSPSAWLSVSAAHSLAAVRGGPQGDVTHNLISLRLQVARPERPRAVRPAPLEDER